MKRKLLFVCVISVYFQNSYAQSNTFPSSGDVGVGTIYPSSYSHGGTNRVLEIHNDGTSTNAQSHLILTTASTNSNSSVGSVTWALPSVQGFQGLGYLGLSTGNSSTPTNPTGVMVFATRGSLEPYWEEKMRIAENGNIGMGTTIPDEKLTVKGKIHAEEVRVDLAVPVPDYVFEKDYQLTPLSEIQNYIKENKHLPEVPSAKEMEEKGINLSEMNMLLLKKVEELTLHLIAQNKLIQEQSDRIKKLEFKK